MSLYKEMYFKLFGQLSKTIEELQKIQQECEKLFVNAQPKPSIKVIDKGATSQEDRDKLEIH